MEFDQSIRMSSRDCEDVARTTPSGAAVSDNGVKAQRGPLQRSFRRESSESPDRIVGTAAPRTAAPAHPTSGPPGLIGAGNTGDERLAQQRLALVMLDRLTAAHASADQGEWAKVLAAVSCDEAGGGTLAGGAVGMGGGPLGDLGGGAGRGTGASQAQFDTVSVIAQIRTALLGKMGRYEEVLTETSHALSGAYSGAAPNMAGALLLHFNRAVANEHLSRWSHVVLDCDVVLSYLCPEKTPSFVCTSMGGGGSASLGGDDSANDGGRDSSTRLGSAFDREKALQFEYKTRIMRASAYARIGRFASVIDDCNVILGTLAPACHLALQNRGFAYLYTGRPSAALRDFERCPASDAVLKGKAAARAKLSCGPLSVSMGAVPPAFDTMAAASRSSRSSLSSLSSSSSSSSSSRSPSSAYTASSSSSPSDATTEVGGLSRVPSSMFVLQSPVAAPNSSGSVKKRPRHGQGQGQEAWMDTVDVGVNRTASMDMDMDMGMGMDLRHFDGNGPVSPVPSESGDSRVFADETAEELAHGQDMEAMETTTTAVMTDSVEAQTDASSIPHARPTSSDPGCAGRRRSLSMANESRGAAVGRGVVKLTSIHTQLSGGSHTRTDKGGSGGMRHSRSAGSLKCPHLLACSRSGSDRARAAGPKTAGGGGQGHHVRHKSM